MYVRGYGRPLQGTAVVWAATITGTVANVIRKYETRAGLLRRRGVQHTELLVNLE